MAPSKITCHRKTYELHRCMLKSFRLYLLSIDRSVNLCSSCWVKINLHQYCRRRTLYKTLAIELICEQNSGIKEEKKREKKKDDFSRRTLSLCMAQIDRWNHQLMHSVWKINKVFVDPITICSYLYIFLFPRCMEGREDAAFKSYTCTGWF